MGVCCTKDAMKEPITCNMITHSEISPCVILDSKTYTDVKNYYNFQKAIGHGHFGTVRLAQRQDANKKYAVKSILKVRLKKGITVLRNELSILRESDHPNIIKVYETYEDDTYVHIVMEYCKGGDLLDNLIQRGQYDEENAAKIFEKILSAINYLHSLSICHRDIKPDNFLFTSKESDAEIKCIDFGLATRFGEDDDMHSKVGTPYYLAPEILRGNYRKECDIWSLGALLYVMLGGYPPFEGKNQNSVFKKIISANYDFKKNVWKNVSAEAKDLIRRMLIPNPKRRITIPLALNHLWLLRHRRMELPKVPLKIFESLKNIKAPRKLEQEAMKVIIQDLCVEEIHELKEAFLAIDAEKTGFITAIGIQQALKNSRLYLAQEHMQKIINSVNYLGYGKLNYTAFLMATLNKKLLIDEEKLYEAFKHFDINNTGFITARDLRIVLQKSGTLVDEENVERMLMEVGLDDKKGLDYDDFKRLIMTQGNTLSRLPLLTTQVEEFIKLDIYKYSINTIKSIDTHSKDILEN